MAKLQKLRGRSARELHVRAAQTFAQLSEQRFGKGMQPLQGDALRNQFAVAARQATALDCAAALLSRLRQPTQSKFFPVFADRTATLAQLQTQYPNECAALIERANQICAGKFVIFEHYDLNFLTNAGAGETNAINWHRDPRTGKQTPLAHWSAIDFLDPQIAGDKKFIWEINRCQWAITLGQAYWLTNDERYAARMVELLQAWIAANPPKRGINWTSSLELSFRVIAWLWGLHFCAASNALTPEFGAELLGSLIRQAEHIETYLSHYFSPNTHLTGEAFGLLLCGVALPELQRAAHWRELGLHILLEQLPRHVRADGVYFEQASYYHRYTTDFYTHLLLLCRANQIELPPLVSEKLVDLHEHLYWITRPDGSSPFYGDDDGGRFVPLATRRADDFRDTLAVGGALFARRDWQALAGPASEPLWLLGHTASNRKASAAAGQVADTSRAALSKAFAESGYYVMRTGWDAAASYVLVDCGLHGALNCGHAHSDALSFEYAAHGTTWLVDPGTYTYTGDWAMRNEIRSSQAHNTVSVDGQSQAEPNTPFTWHSITQALPLEFSTNGQTLTFSGQHNGYTRLSDPVRHQRTLTLTETQLQVIDQMSAKDEHQYALHFHCAVGCTAELVTNETVVLTSAQGARLRLQAQVSADTLTQAPQFEIHEAWVSRCYGQRERGVEIQLRWRGRGTNECRTSFLPEEAATR